MHSGMIIAFESDSMKSFVLRIMSLLSIIPMAGACGNGIVSNFGGTWTIETLNGETVVPAEGTPTLELLPDGKYHIETGINIINGDYRMDDDMLTFQEGMMTRMSGSPEAMAIEDKIVAAIRKCLKIMPLDMGYGLYDTDGSPVMTLKK